MRARFAGAIALALALAPPVAGQTSPQLGFFAGGIALRVRDGAAGRVQTLTSGLPAGEVTVTFSRFLLEGGYAQGSLTAETPAPSRDYVEGKALAGVRITNSIAIKAGAHARSYVLPGGTRRRVFWGIHGAYETPLSGRVAGAHLEVWAALGGDSNLEESLDHARGGEGALLLHIPRSPVWGKLGYRIERAEYDGGARGETIEGLFLSIGVGVPSH